jgi:hypothetical protein
MTRDEIEQRVSDLLDQAKDLYDAEIGLSRKNRELRHAIADLKVKMAEAKNETA